MSRERVADLDHGNRVVVLPRPRNRIPYRLAPFGTVAGPACPGPSSLDYQKPERSSGFRPGHNIFGIEPGAGPRQGWASRRA